MAKVTFDGVNKIMTVKAGTTNIDVTVDLYSDWKEWVLEDDNTKYLPAFRVVGGDPTIGGNHIAGYFFLINGWRMKPAEENATLSIDGILLVDGGGDPYQSTDGTYNVRINSTVPLQAESIIVETGVSGLTTDESDKLLSLENTDLTDTNTKIDNVKTDTEQIITDVANKETLTTEEHDAVIGTNYMERVIFIDTELAEDGNGTAAAPYNSFVNALDYAELNGIRKLIIYSDITVDRNLKNFVIIGVGTPTIDCDGHNLDKSEFSRVVMKGNYTGSIVAQDSVLFDGFHLSGFFEGCALGGDLICNDQTLLANSFSNIPGLNKPSLSVDGHKVSVRNYSGGLLVKDCDNTDSEITVEINQGKVYIEDTCTDGIISVRGIGYIDNQANGTTIDTGGLVQPQDVIDGKDWAKKAGSIKIT